MENKNGSMVFLGVIGVATLVVAIIGATFAFFSASANSATNAISAGAANISLDFSDSTYTNIKTHLIPATETIATYAAIQQEGTNNYYKNDGTHSVNSQCIDDNGNDVCSIYEFTVTNPSATTSQDITATLRVVTNTFWDTTLATPTGNLVYKVYEGSTDATAGVQNGARESVTRIAAGATPRIAETIFGAANSEVVLALDTDTTATVLTLAPGATKTYTIVIYLKEMGEQNKDQGKTFAASLTLTSGSGVGVTGVIAAAG